MMPEKVFDTYIISLYILKVALVKVNDLCNQVQAIVDNVEEQLYKAGFADPKVEGYNSASWILLDYEDVIIFGYGAKTLFHKRGQL